ncbi:MAG: class I SAM-dependent methyltransferase [Bacteroidia bacterium]|nr:class I SAM-dependent methyltransferase [Bacteroidia bacterium]
MSSLTDDRGYNQMFKPSKTMDVRSERRCDILISNMDFSHNTRILEIGCGTGEIANFIVNKTNSWVLGTDICVPFIEEAKQKHINPKLDFKVLDFNDINSFNNNRFDYIIGNGILHHLYNNLDNTLINLKLLLNKNGKIIFLEPNIINPYCYLIFSYPYLRKKAKLEPDEMAFSSSFIKSKLQNSGFNNIKVVYKDFLIPITPFFMVKLVVFIGNILEKNFFTQKLSQSLLIIADNENHIQNI